MNLLSLWALILSATIADFFNEVFNAIQRMIFIDQGVWKELQENNNSRYYNLPLNDYYSMCLRIASEYKISPKEIYETWSLPMMVVTFAQVHNTSVTSYAQELEAIDTKKPKRIDYQKEYIRNVTAEDLAEPQEELQESDAIKALKRQYWGDI